MAMLAVLRVEMAEPLNEVLIVAADGVVLDDFAPVGRVVDPDEMPVGSDEFTVDIVDLALDVDEPGDERVLEASINVEPLVDDKFPCGVLVMSVDVYDAGELVCRVVTSVVSSVLLLDIAASGVVDNISELKTVVVKLTAFDASDTAVLSLLVVGISEDIPVVNSTSEFEDIS